jgi:choline dehydrogenase-like flavoprotein
MARPFDAIVIGTGFAGAVTACRLTEAGQRICVLERGRRFEASDFPVYPTGVRPSTALVGDTGEPEKRVQPDFSRLFWKLGQGLWDVRDLGDVAVAQAAGYGGGSLVYANVHLRAPADVFDHCWPDEYRRPALDPYYDLAAYMLDVAPIEENLPKTVQLERVASQQQERFRFFRPPLAVNFNSSGKNRFGRVQGTCDLRGECLFGCGAQAKNTLDLNYLAIAEDATDGKGAPLADIRTLAEVVSIEGEEKGYKVTYRDHLAGEPGNYVTVTGRYVFLCAGSVNSTELLLRSREKLSCSGPDLGARYYPNADTLAVVFDCENLQEADRGPTITAALLYDRRTQGADPLAERESAPDKPRHWFLVEDGGMPSDLEPLLGAFRSPLWLQRNRFREDESEARIPRSPGGAYGDLPFETATDIVSGLSRGAIESRPELRNAISEFLLMRGQSVPEAGADGEDRRWRLPKQLTDALVEIRDQLLEDVATAGEPLVAGFLDGAAERVESLYELDEALKDLLPDGIDPEGLEGVHLMRRALRLGLQLVWGSEGGMVGDAAHKLLELLMPEQGGVPRRITELLRWALDYRVGDGHTAVLLSMGRDSRPGRLELAAANEATASRPDRGGCPDEHENERREELRSQIEDVWKDELRQSGSPPCQMGASLRACLPGPLETPERTTQELLLRDIATGVRSNGKAARADGLQGELRTNPAWSFLDRRLTVHSQGGCPMPTFTESSGEVKGCQGLYVMDAAAFPTPVGVNPSATIAAVAEYKVERFIRERLRKKAWTAPEMTRANTWAGRRRAQLDPIGSGGRPSAPPYSKPVGIEFKEAMTGFHEPGAVPRTQPPLQGAGDLRHRHGRRAGSRWDLGRDDGAGAPELHAALRGRGANPRRTRESHDRVPPGAGSVDVRRETRRPLDPRRAQVHSRRRAARRLGGHHDAVVSAAAGERWAGAGVAPGQAGASRERVLREAAPLVQGHEHGGQGAAELGPGRLRQVLLRPPPGRLRVRARRYRGRREAHRGASPCLVSRITTSNRVPTGPRSSSI